MNNFTNQRRTYLFILPVLLFFSMVVHGQNQCKIQGLRFEQTACDADGNFYVFLSFDHENTSNSFLVLGNGKNYGTFSYGNLPVKIGPLKGDCTTKYEFLVKDKEFSDCQSFILMGQKCCSSDCRLYIDSIHADCGNTSIDLNIFAQRTDQKEGKYNVKINGEPKGLFNLGSPAQIDNYEYDPLEPIIQVVACVDGSACCDTFDYVNPCYCSITNFKTQIFDCDPVEGVFSIKLDFQNTMTGDSFSLGGNVNNYGKFSYADLPVTIENLPFSETTFYEFLVVDENSSFCFGVYELGIVDSCRFACEISDLRADVLPCDDDGNVFVRLSFEDTNTSHLGFRVRGNGQLYGEFPYGERYYDVGPVDADCLTLREFVVIDREMENCRREIVFEEPFCCERPCEIGEISITENCNDSTLVSFVVNFDHNQEGSSSFYLWANSKKLGPFLYSNLPLSINEFPFDFPLVEFRVVDAGDEACRRVKVYTFDCVPEEQETCVVAISDFILSECNAIGQFLILITVDHQNTGSMGFRIVSENGNVTKEFDYGSTLYNLGPFVGDCETKYSFIIQDIEFPDCKKSYTFEKAFCCNDHEDCFIREVAITEDCDGNNLTGYTINFEHNLPATAFFSLWANGQKIGEFKYNQLPLYIDDITFNTQSVNFKIISLPNENCRKELTYVFECKAENNDDCNLDVLSYEIGDCLEDGTFYIFFKLKADNPGNQGFKVFRSGAIVSTFDYGLASYKIGPFEGNCVTKYSFLIKDNQKPDCATEFGLPEPVCCNEGCEISNIRIEASDCLDGKVDIRVNFDHQNTSSSFTLKLNGETRGQYQYVDLPLIIRQLTPETVYKIFVSDNDKDCVEDFTFTTPLCFTSTEDEGLNNIRATVTAGGILIQSDETITQKVQIILYDVLGRQQANMDFSGLQQWISMESAPSGMYFITLQNGVKNRTLKVYWNK